MANLLEGPVYTKPPEWRGHEVPEMLLSGHHGKIARWRRDEALRRTAGNRPELMAGSTRRASTSRTGGSCERARTSAGSGRSFAVDGRKHMAD